MKLILYILSTVTFCSATFAQVNSEGIKAANIKDADLNLMQDHDPASELANFTLMDGYQVNLFAAEPMLANPVHMVWDSKGRLWVACSWAYPQLKPGDVANDKIIILEDTDNDGQADKSTVFADGLYLPTGIELANGGCYVAQSPDVFFFKDTNGDDQADTKELALTGFGIEDSHHSISAWRRGPGGWIYFQEGIFLHTQVETQHGVVRNFNGGVYQFNPRTQELRMFVRGTGGNPWGHVFDRWGQSFMVNNPRIMYLSPASGASPEPNRVPPLISTEKQCGGDLATGMHLGDDIRGQLLTCRFKSRTIIRYEFVENGAGFSASVLPPLIASKHPNFRPVDCKVGPDGAIYVADWYNSIINHAQHDFRDPRRDHEHGRIWRITHKNRPLIQKPKLEGEPIEQLVDQLKSPNTWTRHQARKELSERDPSQVLEAVEDWVENLDASNANYPGHLVEAMWACQNVEQTSEPILKKVIESSDGQARSAAARIIRYWYPSLSDPIRMIAQLASDPFPRARMEAVLSAGFIPRAESFSAALHVLDHERDRFIDAALAQTVRALEPYWQPRLHKGTLEFAKTTHHDFATKFSGLGFDDRLSAFLGKRVMDEKEATEFKSEFIQNAESRHVQSAFRSITSKRSRLPQVSKLVLLDALEQIGKKGKISLENNLPNLSSQLTNRDDAFVSAVASNIGAWKLAKSSKGIVNLLKNEGRSESTRISAAQALGALGLTSGQKILNEMTGGDDLTNRYIATFGLVEMDLSAAARSFDALMTKDPGDFDPSELIAQFLGKHQGSSILLTELNPDQFHPMAVDKVAAYHHRTGQLSNQLAELFVPTSTTSLNEQLKTEDREKLVADVVRHGDPVKGEMIFRRPSSACAICHGIGSVGPSTGPNLVAVGAAADPAYMVEAILEPNKSIAEHYENVMLTLKDGTVRTGVISHKSEQEIVLRDSANPGDEIHVALNTVNQQSPLASLMPEGLADLLNNRQEFLDLSRFLSLLGRPGPYENNEKPFIRKWRIVPGQPDTLPTQDAAWMPAYSMVNGLLPADDLGDEDTVYVQGYIHILAAGSLKLGLNEDNGLRLWIDGNEIKDLSSEIHATRGRKTLTFAIDRKKRGDTGLQVLLNAADKSVKFQPEGGL